MDGNNCFYQWRVYKRKIEPKINFDVHVRPKSAKEIGYIGRITSIGTNTAAISHTNLLTESSASQHSSKKRKLTEDVRVTIQQHCYNHNTNKNEACITCQSTKQNVRSSRLAPVYDLHFEENTIDNTSKGLVIITPDTTSYRQLATSHLRPNDYVLEIGCSTGECTALLLRRNLLLHNQYSRRVDQHNETEPNAMLGKVVGFDTGAKILKQADNRLRREYEQSSGSALASDDNSYSKLVQLHRVDALADPKGAHNLATANNTCPGIVLIDIGGNRQLESVLRMIQWVQTAFKDERPRLILIKSEALETELSTAMLSSHPRKDDNNSSVPCVDDEGIIRNGQNWFNSLLVSHSFATGDEAKKSISRQQLLSRYSHPKKVPLVSSPNGTAICRYHNYHPDGCKKYNRSKNSAVDEVDNDMLCPYDHEHCHWCQAAGHIALNCPSLK